jgi:hypothetical protein
MSILPTTNFAVLPANYLGHEYASFKNALYKLALTEPAKYFTLREQVLQSVQKDAINQIYTTIFNLLNDGKDGKGVPLFNVLSQQRVAYPQQKINEISLGFSATLDEMVQEVVELLMPIDFQTIMNKKLASTPATA